MYGDNYWRIHNLFYSPPGTPKNLRCIGCKYAVAGASALVTLAGAYGTRKTMPGNIFRGMACIGITFVGLCTTFIATRMARDDQHWNETRYVEYLAEVKAKRESNKEQMKQVS